MVTGVNLPVLGGREAGGLQLSGQGDKSGHQHNVQAHDAKVKLQQARLRQHLAKAALHHPGFAVKDMVMAVGHHPQGEQDADGRQDGDHPEQRVQTQLVGDNRPQHHGDGEGDAEADADKGHRFGAVLFAGEIGQQGHNRGGDGAGALQGAAKNDAPDGVGERGDDAAEHEDKQAADDQWLTANTVR